MNGIYTSHVLDKDYLEGVGGWVSEGAGDLITVTLTHPLLMTNWRISGVKPYKNHPIRSY
jgi:hypothetical protein